MLRAAELAGVPAVEVRTISNRPADSDRGAVADRGRARPARGDRPAAARGAASLCATLTLRVLAVPERHVRVPRARARARRRAVSGRAGAARHRGAEPARAHGRARPDEALASARSPGRRPLPRCCGAGPRSATASGRSSSRASERSLDSARGSRSRAARRRRSCSSRLAVARRTATWSSCATTEILGAVEAGEVDAGPDHPREPLHLRRPRPRQDRRPRRVVGAARPGCRCRSPGSVARARSRRRDRRRCEAAIRARSSTPSRTRRRAASTSARTRRSCPTRSATRTSRST